MLRLFGYPTLETATGRLELLPHKPVCLMLYLAMQETWVSREVLATLFWPDSDEEGARRNLRMMISRVKDLAWAEGLEISPVQLRWQIETDYGQFKAALGAGEWQVASELHSQPLLETWRVPDVAGFEIWLELERELLLDSWREAVMHVVGLYRERADHEKICTLLAQVLRQNPLEEDVIAQYLESAYLSGRREEALKSYDRFVQQLKEELGLEPLDETQALAATIRSSGKIELREVTEAASSAIPLSLQRPPRLIGREKESLRVLQSKARVILLSAEPGMGKTRLLAEFAPQEAILLKGQEGLETIPYYPIMAYLRSLETLPDLGSYERELARLVPDRFPEMTQSFPVEALTAKARLLEALARVFEKHPVIVIDDLQWLDEASLELLSFLVHRTGTKLMGSYRSTEVSPALLKTLGQWSSAKLSEEIHLLPLEETDLGQLLASLNDFEEEPRLFIQWLLPRSGGNPFFALEILKALFEARVLTQKEGVWSSSLDSLTQDYSELEAPKSIRDAALRRIERLPEIVQRVLQVAAVIAQGFSARDIAEVAGLSEWAVLEAVEAAEGAGLISEGRFVHDLFRQTLYKQLSQVRKKALHAHVAALFSDRLEPALIADHYWAAEMPKEAAAAYIEAAKGYKQKGLHHEAIRLLETMTARLSDPELRSLGQLEIMNSLVELEPSPELERLIASFSEHPNPAYRSVALNNKAILCLTQGEISRARDAYQTWLALPLAFSEDEKIQQILLKAQLEFYEGDYAATLETSKETLSLLKEKGLSIDLANTLTNLASALDVLEQHHEARQYHYEAYRVAKTLESPHTQIAMATNILWNAMAAGDLLEAIALAEDALTLGDYSKSMTLRLNLATAYIEQGDVAKAEDLYAAIASHSTDPTLLAIAWSRLAAIREDQGTKEKALEQALKYAFETDFRVAHVRVGISVLDYGNQDQIEQILPLLKERIDFDALTEAELKRALANHGLKYPL